MYCSIDKIDLAARVEGRPIAVQTDHRPRSEIEAEPELSALIAMARVLNARSHLTAEGHPSAAVHYAVAEEPPPLLREALAACGSVLDRAKILEALGTHDEHAVNALADRCFAELAARVKRRVGSRDSAIALSMLEQQTFAAPPDRGDEAGYWRRVLELAALAGELLRAKYPGHWVQTDRAVVPFGFQVGSGTAVMFPTNRAQRVIEDGPDESLFKLLLAADETVHRQTDATASRLMPSLRHRADIELDEVTWRPLLDDASPVDLPVVVCGVDGENTFGMLRREALPKPADLAFADALSNLADEEVEIDELEVGGLPLAVVTGSFYAAEKLLDRAFMATLHPLLDAELLIAATPARGCLLVTAAVDDAPSLSKFAAIVRARHADAGGRAISPAMLLVERGEVAGYVRGPGDPIVEPPPERVDRESTRADTVPAAPKRSGFLRRLLGRK
ncbi:MAG TPA: hypothetical protein VL326_10165 [Kofleriaceae bacterium]|nr:hypothetical protein [Kofleriaceae bacterium]